MELSKIPTLVVGLIVAILIVTVVAIPIIDDSTQYIQSTAQNAEGRYMMTSTTEPTTITMVDGVYTVNGEEIDDGPLNYQIKVFSSEFMIAFNSDGAFANLYSPSIPGVMYNISKIEFDPVEGKATATISTGSTLEYSIDSLFYLHPKGEYGYFQAIPSDYPIHVTNGATWYLLVTAFTQEGGKTAWASYKYTGTTKEVYMDGFGKASSDESSYSLGTVGVSVQTEAADSKHFDITGVSDVTFSTATMPANICKIIAPIEYMEISKTDGSIISIINIIPILLIVALLTAIVGTVFVRTQ